MKVLTVKTSPYHDQKPGTSGLRKLVRVFQQKNYVENFIQSILNAQYESVKDSCLVVGGDGRYFSKYAINCIIKICAANQVNKLIIGQNGILSTPACSHLIRKYKTLGGILLTASHNPGGIDGDFGIKFNISNGGPAPDFITEKIYYLSETIEKYFIIPDIVCDLNKIGIQEFQLDNGKFIVEIIDPVEDYVQYVKELFDFNQISHLVNKFHSEEKPLKMLINSMHGVTGPYVERIFCKELNVSSDFVINTVPLEDFGGCHPDPNLTYAADLVEKMKNGKYDFGAAFDGDGDRNMILGSCGLFVTPSDSLAILAANMEAIPYFKKTGCKGLARSMPTSSAIDRVANVQNKKLFEVPTGWKYFGNLMDAGSLSLCGEESFGTGSDHIREKDGIWAVLAWLSLMAHYNKSVEEIQCQHWMKFGRNYYTRYDYENCTAEAGAKLISYLEKLASEKTAVGHNYYKNGHSYIVSEIDSFIYVDPIDKHIAKSQGVRIFFTEESRIVFRLSGTGSSGATIRIYLESYERDINKLNMHAPEVLQGLGEIAIEISQLKHFIGYDVPTVIT